MIVRSHGDTLWLFMQPDHALLSGIMASHWGNDAFARPVEPERTASAIGRHDDGWTVWEQDPRVDRRTNRPFNFTTVPLHEILTIWYLGPKMAGERDPYAGLLVSRHGSYLMQNRLKHTEDAEEKERLQRYLQDQETLRERLEARLERTEPEPSGKLLAGVDHAYQLLQLCDDLSLRFCTGPLEPGSVNDAPRADLEDPVTLSVQPVDEDTLTLDPWPFDAEEILLPAPLYELPDRDYTTYSDLKSTMIGSPRRIHPFRLLKRG